MTIVVDIGCADHGVDSVHYLAERFHPDVLYGFDPWPGLEESDFLIGDTRVELCREAAWTHYGEIPYTADGTGSRVGEGSLTVPCFNLGQWLSTLEGDIVVKMDAEGAEYPLLRYLIDTGADKRLTLLLVEWHDADGDHGLLGELACPVEEWDR